MLTPRVPRHIPSAWACTTHWQVTLQLAPDLHWLPLAFNQLSLTYLTWRRKFALLQCWKAGVQIILATNLVANSMCRRKLLYRIGLFLLACIIGCWGLWFTRFRPIIPIGKIGELQFEKRAYQHFGIEDGEYELGVFFVPENRSKPNSRVIPVDYARFLAKESIGPPIFLLPGGPGNSYINSGGKWLGKAPDYLENLRAFNDVVFVDQRGYSPRRRAKLSYWKATAPRPRWTLADEVADFESFAEKATASHRDTGVDLSGYNILECAADVDDLRHALGYEKIMLMGHSFGSQWCFAVMRKHPEIVERAILTGVEPLSHTYDRPSHLMNAVRRIWKHLDSEPAWGPYLPSGGMEEAAEAVLARLENGGIEIKDDISGETRILLGPSEFPWDYPAQILELFHNRTERWSEGRKKYFSNYKLIYPLIDTSIGVTADRREQLWNDPAVRYVSRNTSNFASFLATADIWPTPDVGDDFRNPVQCDIPVVFIHGDWDRYTPIENTLEIAPFFPNSHSLLIERGGHSPLKTILKQHPDVFSTLMDFAKIGSTEGLPEKITARPDLGHNKELPRIDL